MSPEHRIRFGDLPRSVHLEGAEPIEFTPRPPTPTPEEMERRSLVAELAALRAQVEATKQADAELRSRLEKSVADLARAASDMKRELVEELDAARPAMASLALAIAERALVKNLADDPLLLLPAAERAVERVKMGLDAELVVEVRTSPAAAQAFEVAVLGRQDGALRIVADPSLQDGTVEARIDVRRVRHSVTAVLSDVRRTLDPNDAKPDAPRSAMAPRQAVSPAPVAAEADAAAKASRATTATEPNPAPKARSVAPSTPPRSVRPADLGKTAPRSAPATPNSERASGEANSPTPEAGRG